MAVAPRILTSGDPVVAFGRLTCMDGASVDGQIVQMFARLGAARAYSPIGSATTGEGGFYELTSLPAVSASVPWLVRCDGVRSAAEQIKVAAQVTLAGPPDGAQLLTGPANRVTFTGTVSPTDAGAAVVLQRQDSANGGVWHRIDATATVGPEGHFAIVHTFAHPGFPTVRVLVSNRSRANPHNAPSPSNTLSYEVAKAQSPHPTIAVSADVLTATVSATSVAAGQPLTFSGTVAPAHNGHVIYLEAQNAGGTGFHVIELGAVGAGSAYSIVHTSYAAGTQIFRVAIPGDPESEGAASAPFTVQVTPAPASTLMPEAPGNSGLPVGGQL